MKNTDGTTYHTHTHGKIPSRISIQSSWMADLDDKLKKTKQANNLSM